MVEEQNTGKAAAAVTGCEYRNSNRKAPTAHRSRHRPAGAAVTDCAARTLARRLLPGLEQARAIIDVAILTMRYYDQSPSDPNGDSSVVNAEKARRLIHAFDDGRSRP